jgi:hypothetical protein
MAEGRGRGPCYQGLPTWVDYTGWGVHGWRGGWFGAVWSGGRGCRRAEAEVSPHCSHIHRHFSAMSELRRSERKRTQTQFEAATDGTAAHRRSKWSSRVWNVPVLMQPATCSASLRKRVGRRTRGSRPRGERDAMSATESEDGSRAPLAELAAASSSKAARLCRGRMASI